MTKKHFKELAALVKNRRAEIGNQRLFNLLCNDLANFCHEQNSRFDRSRFLEACGVNDEIEESIATRCFQKT